MRQERYRKFFQEVIPEGEWKLIRKISNVRLRICM